MTAQTRNPAAVAATRDELRRSAEWMQEWSAESAAGMLDQLPAVDAWLSALLWQLEQLAPSPAQTRRQQLTRLLLDASETRTTKPGDRDGRQPTPPPASAQVSVRTLHAAPCAPGSATWPTPAAA